MDSKNIKYIILTIILLILSGLGVFFIFRINNSPLDLLLPSSETPDLVETPTSVPTRIPTIAVTPTASASSTAKEKTNLLKISDIKMTFPENWKVISTTENTARILTDYQQYQVYLTLSLEKNSSNAKSSYNVEGKTNAIKTQYGEVYSISSGGGAGMTGAHLNSNFYIFQWDIESNQKAPANLDGVWQPDSNITEKILLDITKTIQPLNQITITPTAIPTTKITAAPTIKITPTPIATSGPLNFKSTDDGFSIDYSSSRKLYQDTESTGNRYTFYSAAGNFAVHVSPSGTWSWTNSNRNFNAALIISGQNTFRYDISTQTIVDLQSSSKNYTLQCIHNGKTDLKTECEAFVKSLQLL